MHIHHFILQENLKMSQQFPFIAISNISHFKSIFERYLLPHSSVVASTFGGSSPVVDAGLPVLLPFAMACIGGDSFSGGGSRWFP